MPARWKLGLALLALSLAGPLRAQPAAPAVIARCASQAGAAVAGVAALSKACPGLQAALDQLGVPAWLPPGWRKALTAHQLADLSALLGRYAQTPSSEAPRAATLRSIAARLAPPRPPPTWSERIRIWIQHRMGSLLQPVLQWLRHLGARPGRSAPLKALIYALVALLLAAIAVFLAVELRRAGLFRRRHAAAAQRRHRRVGGSVASPAEADAGEPDWALLREQPARVLRLLVDTLTRARRLDRDRYLTCRELEMQARFDSETERAGFGRVARLAERELYGPPGAAVLSEEALRAARELHLRLLASAGNSGDLRA